MARSWRWRRPTAVPAGCRPEHVHPQQVERFEILDGTMRTIIGGARSARAAASIAEFLTQFSDEIRLTGA